MLLANNTSRSSSGVSTESLENAYLDIGILRRSSFGNLSSANTFSVAKEKLPWRLTYKLDSKEVSRSEEFLLSLVSQYEGGSSDFL